ncbi:caspase family protein [Nibrella viscosa]|uniref:caspase family protein n=1 Tax=Nibrella viscosa TaxID=1084524 RepID=UPI0031E64936
MLWTTISALAQSKSIKIVGGSAPRGTERRLALVVGNKDYAKPGAGLRNPVNDATDMAQALEELGFTVLRRQNLNRSGLEAAIDEFTEQLTRYEVGLFYFSGHGLAFSGENYLVPTDASLSFETQARSQCVSLRRVLDGMEGANAKVSLVFLDACRNNPFPKSTKGGVSQGLVIPNNPRGSLVAFATRDGRTADDNPGERNGLFTGELLKHLRTPNLGLRAMLDRTIAGVESRSGGHQIPGRYDELRGDFMFVQTAGWPKVTEDRRDPVADNILPSVYSLKTYMPTIGNQGNYGTAVAWAACYVRTIMEARRQGLAGQQSAIDALRFSPTYIFEQVKQVGDKECQLGSLIEPALLVMQRKGAVLLASLPYPSCGADIVAYHAQASRYKIGGFEALSPSSNQTRLSADGLKQALVVSKNAVVIGFQIPRSFMSAGEYWQPEPTESPKSSVGSSALTLIGYDDQKNGGSFLLANSWGKNWGKEGYIWIRYDVLTQYASLAYQIGDPVTPVSEKK